MTNKVADKANLNWINMFNRPDQKTVFFTFIDIFYALASNKAQERNLAASYTLCHLFSQDISTDDDTNKIAVIQYGHYAFARLLKELYS